MSKVFVFLSVLLLGVTTVIGQKRIVGGNEAPPPFGLFHASLQNLTGYHVCGGAIVSKWHVVTAGHCLEGAKPDYIKVIVGTTYLNEGGIKYEAASISINKSFNFTSKANDIALLKVKEPFDLNYVRIISLSDEYLIEGDIVFLSGFGAKMVDGESSNQMYLLTVPVFSQKTCRYAMRYTREVTSSMFCTFTKFGQGTCKVRHDGANLVKMAGFQNVSCLKLFSFADRSGRTSIENYTTLSKAQELQNIVDKISVYKTCGRQGDSGSPIIKDDKLVGVVSWGIPCAVGFPDVHTRVAPFIKWIRDEIRNDICGMKQKYGS